jgi:hypothetical protein
VVSIHFSSPSRGVIGLEALKKSLSPLPGEVFAVELLTRPITIERNDGGRTIATIDRRDVQEYLISNEGRTEKCSEYITSANSSLLQAVDKEIQRFLCGAKPFNSTVRHMLGATDRHMKIDPAQLGIRLRWASGGVLSRVRFANDKTNGEWIPLTFRDIPPYGWNISLGSSERGFHGDSLDPNRSLETELNKPCNYILREFIEEYLVLNGAPAIGAPLSAKAFVLGKTGRLAANMPDRPLEEKNWPVRFVEDHLSVNTMDMRTIEVTTVPQQFILNVISGSNTTSVTHDVLVVFSLLDLGIEVVKVVKYELEPNDYLLDGEILRSTHGGINELVRAPIALFSCEYLDRVFGTGFQWQNYTGGLQPSIEVNEAPDSNKDEIRIFEWDLHRRMDIVRNRNGTVGEVERFERWYTRFGQNFLGTSGKPSSTNVPRLFGAGTAKILNLHFSALRNRGTP